ncbi:MAG: methyltransferase family protein [Promethearchaeati archaeon]
MKEEFKIFLEKVPALRSKGKAFLTIIYSLGLIGLSIIYFYFLDRIAWYMPIITQIFMAIIVSMIGYVHIKRANYYRNKYGDLAYQKYFYRYIIPLLITWYAIFFHPLFISGPPIFPIWVFPFWTPLLIGIILFIVFILVNLHIERAGFKMVTHGMDIYTIFPEETPIVRGEIYSYIRHPLYLSLTLGCFALAIIANNYIALISGFIQIIPCIIMGKIEDKELIKRDGTNHLEYIESTAILFPIKRIGGFLKLLFFLK